MNGPAFSPVVVYRVTDYCNLNCVFCAHARSLSRPRRQAAPSAVRALGKLLGAHRKQTGNPILVNWLGGGPLAWSDLVPATMLYKNYGLDISATTNGTTLLNTERRTFVARKFTQLTVSVDGFEAFHDAKRGAKGLFRAVEKGVRALVQMRDAFKSPLRIRMNTVLMSENVTAFPDLCRSFANWGIDEITYNQLGGRDRPETFDALRLRPQDIDFLAQTLPSIQSDMKARGVYINTNPTYLDRFRAYALNQAMEVENCNPGRSFLFVDEQTRIAPCNFTVDSYGVSVRDVPTLAAFQNLPNVFAERQRTTRDPACRNCMSTQVSGKFKPA